MSQVASRLLPGLPWRGADRLVEPARGTNQVVLQDSLEVSLLAYLLEEREPNLGVVYAQADAHKSPRRVFIDRSQ